MAREQGLQELCLAARRLGTMYTKCLWMMSGEAAWLTGSGRGSLQLRFVVGRVRALI